MQGYEKKWKDGKMEKLSDHFVSTNISRIRLPVRSRFGEGRADRSVAETNLQGDNDK